LKVSFACLTVGLVLLFLFGLVRGSCFPQDEPAGHRGGLEMLGYGGDVEDEDLVEVEQDSSLSHTVEKGGKPDTTREK
jgi:hypothetical protein